MKKIVSWSIVNNEISFIKDILDFHVEWLDAMYFLDTGSTDGTLEILRDYAARNHKIFLEEYPIKYTPQYDVEWQNMTEPFPEVIVRNYAIRGAENNLDPQWLIQLDGDEVFLPSTREVIEQFSDKIAIGHSTINPVCALEEHPLEHRGGHQLHDPHVRVWKAHHAIEYIANPFFKGHQYHCIPTFNNTGNHLYHHPGTIFSDSIFHFHLHWMYGKKVEGFYSKKGITDKQLIINDQQENKHSHLLPSVFWTRRQEWLIQ